MTTPYTYLIGWSKHDKWYYGCRFAKHCTPEDLWLTYHTSSRHVEECREIFGEPDVKEVRKTFTSIDKCREWEHKVLKRLKVTKSDKWINRTDNKSFTLEGILRGSRKSKNRGNSNCGGRLGKTKETDEWIRISTERMAQSKRGKPTNWTPEGKARVIQSGKKSGVKAALNKTGIHSESYRRSEKKKEVGRRQGLLTKGKRWMYFPNTANKRRVTPDQIEDLLMIGWKLGSGPRVSITIS